jgi:bifunctional ADP-heptose synthase (sugar kinase/adenylyltransferase)
LISFILAILIFLEKQKLEAKTHGDILMLLLESDERVKQLKGYNRPIFSQSDRAQLLASIESIDYIVLLEDVLSDKDYARLTQEIKPDIIAVTKGDPLLGKKRGQAEFVGGVLIELPFNSSYSSSTIIERIKKL